MEPSRPSYSRSRSFVQPQEFRHGSREKSSRLTAGSTYYRSRSQHPRSPSIVQKPYTSNCSRKRSWPPPPKVEEIKVEEEIPMRGKIGQNPMIIDVPYGSDTRSEYSSSDESSGPETPPSSTHEHQHRQYTWKAPQYTDSLPNIENYSKNSGLLSRQNSRINMHSEERGRKPMPKLDTEFARSKSKGEPLPQLERARSPYASGPQDRKAKENRFSGEYLLSPEMISPRPRLNEGRRSHSHYDSRAAEPQGNRAEDSPVRPSRPSLGRHASAYDYRTDKIPGRASPKKESAMSPGRPFVDDRFIQPSTTSRTTNPKNDKKTRLPTSEQQKTTPPSLSSRRSTKEYMENPPSTPSTARYQTGSLAPQGYSDSSDSDSARYRAKHAPQNNLRNPTENFRTGKRDQEGPLPARQDTKRSMSTVIPDSPAVNLRSLVSGDGIHQVLNAAAVNAALKKDSAFARTASPRHSPHPSPGVSPLASPHDSPNRSPPQTPPNEHRANPVSSLKKDSPHSRPPSPLSSRSLLSTVQPRTGEISGPDDAFQPPPLRPRHTSPLSTPPVDDSKLGQPPGIAVRSPSPAAHTKNLSMDSYDHQHPYNRAGSFASPSPTSTSGLRPTGFSSRPRAASSADVRPHLTVVPTPFANQSEAISTGKTRSRAASPTPMASADKYKPAYAVAPSPTIPNPDNHGSHNLDPSTFPRAASKTAHTTHDGKVRSYIPDYVSNDRGSPHVSSTSPVPTVPTAPPVAQKPAVPLPTPKPLTSLPSCPRPKRVAGYDDWFTFPQNSAFCICPECRKNVFGKNSESYLVPKTVVPERKVHCDLNNPWIRLTCLYRGPDIGMLSQLCDITSKEGRCPEDYSEPRDWYRLEDPETKKHISGFHACPECVLSLEVLFPAWQDIFYLTGSSRSQLRERTCSLREYKSRAGEFLDMFVESGTQYEKKKRSLNTKPVVKLAKQLASIQDCPRDKMLSSQSWHIHTHMPEFTVCQDCYEKVIYPLAKQGLPIASNFDKEPHQLADADFAACCQLYSERMRDVFQEACEDDDWEHLRHTAMKRYMVQRDMLSILGEQKEAPDDEEVRERLGERLREWKQLE